ncbi:hypothetical protein [Streptomyces odontomachi]|uniref:hypothetical protein n=1 Tax=Streptomyces odontomachi TaxID=2944940 RepID=UPI00210C047C|nr:hypothetical protein [Streptomyces sp. ODS25]
MSVGKEARAGQAKPQQSLGTAAARSPATTTKPAPRMQAISSHPVTAYCSAAVLVPDVPGVPGNVEIGRRP